MKKNDTASVVLVVVGPEVIEVQGTRLRTADELLAFLAEHKIARIELETADDGDEERGQPFYEVIGKVIYSTTRLGIEIVRIDGRSAPTPP